MLKMFSLHRVLYDHVTRLHSSNRAICRSSVSKEKEDLKCALCTFHHCLQSAKTLGEVGDGVLCRGIYLGVEEVREEEDKDGV